MQASQADIEAAVQRACDLLLGRRPADAVKACSEALARGLDAPRLRLLAAHGLLAQAQHEEASRQAYQALRLSPWEPEAHRILAEAALARGRFGAAREHLRRVLELDAADASAQDVLDQLSREATWAGRFSDAGAGPALHAVTTEAFVEALRGNRESGTSEAGPSGIEEVGTAVISGVVQSPSFVSHEEPVEQSDTTDELGLSDMVELPSAPRGYAEEDEPLTNPHDHPAWLDAVSTARTEHSNGFWTVPAPATKPAPNAERNQPRETFRASADPQPGDSVLFDPDTMLPAGDVGRYAQSSGGFAAMPSSQVAGRVAASADDREPPAMDMAGSEDAGAAHGQGVFSVESDESEYHPVVATQIESDAWDPLAAAEHEDRSLDQQTRLFEPPQKMDRSLQMEPSSSRSSRGWLLPLLLVAVVGAAGGYGYVRYRDWKLTRAQWQQLRQGLLAGTAAGLERADSLAQQIASRGRETVPALAARALVVVMRTLDLGEGELSQAKAAVGKLTGADSEWRTAAQGLLSLAGDPSEATGYLKKGTEAFSGSALLQAAYGRALIAAHESNAAVKALETALRLDPEAATPRLDLARTLAELPDGWARARKLLDEVLARDPGHVAALVARARLRSVAQKQLKEAASDLQRVTHDLRAKAGRRQLAWAQLLIARLARQRNDVAALGSSLDAALASAPCCDPVLSYNLAGELIGIFRWHDAQLQMKSALALESHAAMYLQRMARIALAFENVVEAERWLAGAPSTDPVTLLLRGRIALLRGHEAEWRKALGEASRYPETSTEARVYLALGEARLGEREEAIKSLRLLAHDQPQAELVPQAIGRIALEADDYALAEGALKRAGRINALDPATPTLLGRVSLARHDVDRAKKHFGRALELRPEYTPARLGLTELAMLGRDVVAAKSELEKVPNWDRERASYRVMAARLALAEGQADQAEALIEAAARTEVVSAERLQPLRAALELVRGHLREGERLHDTAKGGAATEEAELWVMRGKGELKAHRFDEAQRAFEEALTDDDGHPEALLELGRLAIRQQDYVTALRRLEGAREMMRARQWPRRQLARVATALGHTYFLKQDTGRAISNLQDAIDADPSAAEPYYLMAQVYDRLDRPERAAGYYQQSIERDGSYAPAYFGAGRALAATGQTDQAITYLRGYLEREPRGSFARAARTQLAKLGE